MDKVFFIIQAHEVFVGEYYKEQIRQVKFKDKDFYEVFDKHDWLEMIDCMNYPMNYQEFKDNEINILYHAPEKYEMIYDVRDAFVKASEVKLGSMIPYLKKCYYQQLKKEVIHKEVDYICYEQSYYKIQKYVEAMDREEIAEPPLAEMVDEWMTLKYIGLLQEEEIETLKGRICEVTTEEVCACLHEDPSMIVDLEMCYPVLAPVTLYKEETTPIKQSFLETSYWIDESSLLKQGTQVTVGMPLFTYTKKVNKWFGKKELQKLEKKSPVEGYYFRQPHETNDTKWANKNQLIGVINPSDKTEKEMREWMKKTGYMTDELT